MADLMSGLSIVAANPGRGYFAGPRDSALIVAAENALGGELPPTYREFVGRLGAGNFGSFEVYGVIDDEFDDSTVPNGIWLTLNERRENHLPNDLVVVGSTGNGDYYCVELRGGQESPVIVYQLGSPPNQQRREVVAEDFGAFLLGHVRDQM